MGKAPAFPLYAADWLSDGRVRNMTPEQRAVYLDLLLFQWREGGIDQQLVENRRTLARLCGIGTCKFGRIWAKISPHFPVDSDGKFRNSRVENERKRQENFRERQSNAANSKHRKDAAAGAGLAVPARASVSGSVSVPDLRKIEDPDPRSSSPSASAQLPLASVGSEAARPPPAPRRRAEAQELAETYKARWRESRSVDGKVPELSAADWSAARRLVQAHGLDVAKGYVERFLADADPFIERRGHQLRDLLSRVNAYRSNAALRPLRAVGVAPPASIHRGGFER